MLRLLRDFEICNLMNAIRKLAAIVLLSISIPAILNAQVDSEGGSIYAGQSPSIEERVIQQIKEKPLNTQIGLSFMISNPQDSLRSALSSLNATDVGLGFTLSAAYSFDPIPIVLGGDFSMTFFGGDSRRKEIPNQIGTTDVIEHSISNTQIPITLFMRVQPNIETWVHPYIELAGGMNNLISRLTVQQRNGRILNSDSDVQGETSWLYGVGGGLMVKFADIISLPNTLQRFLIDVRLRYIKGSSVEVPWISINKQDPSYTVQRINVDSPTWVFFNIGITAQF